MRPCEMEPASDKLVEAMLQHTFNFLVGILQFKTDGSVFVGSGITIEIEGHFFIATAAHNLSGSRDSELVIVKSSNASDERIAYRRRCSSEMAPEYEVDVGFLEISPDEALSFDKRFLRLSRLKPFTNHTENSVFLSGYPASVIPAEKASRGVFQLGAVGYLTTTRVPVVQEGYNDSKDIYVDYEPKAIRVDTHEHIHTPGPYGLSGCGIWAFPPIREGKVWSPEESVLIGIERSWLRNRQLVVGTQIQHWIEIVATHYNDLQRPLRAFLEI